MNLVIAVTLLEISLIVVSITLIKQIDSTRKEVNHMLDKILQLVKELNNHIEGE